MDIRELTATEMEHPDTTDAHFDPPRALDCSSRGYWSTRRAYPRWFRGLFKIAHLQAVAANYGQIIPTHTALHCIFRTTFSSELRTLRSPLLYSTKPSLR